MRFLADEDVPAAVVTALRGADYDVTDIAEVASGSLDPEVLSRAGSERRLLITSDRDFGTLVFARGRPVPSGVIRLRPGAAPPTWAPAAVLEVIEDPKRELIGYFTVTEPGRVRQRRLPS